MLFSSPQEDMTNNGCNLQLFIKKGPFGAVTFSPNLCRWWRFTPPGVSREYFRFNASFLPCLGYGNLSPSTAAGRIFCIMFALFGIPLNLVLLNEIGQLMLLGVQHCARRLEEVCHWRVSSVDRHVSNKKRQRTLSGIWDPVTNKDSLADYLTKMAIILRNNWKRINLVYDSPMRCQIRLFINRGKFCDEWLPLQQQKW